MLCLGEQKKHFQTTFYTQWSMIRQTTKGKGGKSNKFQLRMKWHIEAFHFIVWYSLWSKTTDDVFFSFDFWTKFQSNVSIKENHIIFKAFNLFVCISVKWHTLLLSGLNQWERKKKWFFFDTFYLVKNIKNYLKMAPHIWHKLCTCVCEFEWKTIVF